MSGNIAGLDDDDDYLEAEDEYLSVIATFPPDVQAAIPFFITKNIVTRKTASTKTYRGNKNNKDSHCGWGHSHAIVRERGVERGGERGGERGVERGAAETCCTL